MWLKKANIAFLILAVLVSCKPSSNDKRGELSPLQTEPVQAPVEKDFSSIKSKGKITAIVDNSSTSYFIYKGKPMGFEYELLELLASELGLDLEINITTDIDKTFEKLNNGEGDIIAYNLTVTKERSKKVLFTNHHSESRQVLVQRKPKNWRQLKLHQIEKLLLRNPIDLIGKEVYVRKSSAFVSRLHHLSEEIGGDIVIVEDYGEVETEALIEKVANGEIEYTIADDFIAKINKVNYPNLDVKTPISFPQKIAWAVRKNAPDLQTAINNWLQKLKQKPDYNLLYKKYFENYKASYQRAQSEYSTINGSRISAYDELVKEAAAVIAWDWKLLSSLIFQESRFDPKAKSWAGAVGIMQLIPETAASFGVKDPFNPRQSINAGTKYIKWLDEFWRQRIPEQGERIKFILASYNIGQGHILDAYRLAEKYGQDQRRWDNHVEKYLLLKSNPKYFNDPVVKSGYCIGRETVNYVNEVMKRYQSYSQLLTDANS